MGKVKIAEELIEIREYQVPNVGGTQLRLKVCFFILGVLVAAKIIKAEIVLLKFLGPDRLLIVP